MSLNVAIANYVNLYTNGCKSKVTGLNQALDDPCKKFPLGQQHISINVSKT